MKKTSIVITSIANDSHPILNQYALNSRKHNASLIVIGDTKSPEKFSIDGCDFYSIEHQKNLEFSLSKNLPTKHYARKNLGYLIAMKQGDNIIIETDDDNIPLDNFWMQRSVNAKARLSLKKGWVNVYKYFSDEHIWPRGFNLECIHDAAGPLGNIDDFYSPIQQGLANNNPDVDAIYRLTLPLPIIFKNRENLALASGSISPFNSQNTTWFKDAFPLLYLPSYCSFRMTDIWRSFVAQRIAWTCNWPILFHNSSVEQVRNDHSLIVDFEDEISGYLNNARIISTLINLPLKDGRENILENLEKCYISLVALGVVSKKELPLLKAWINDVTPLI